MLELVAVLVFFILMIVVLDLLGDILRELRYRNHLEYRRFKNEYPADAYLLGKPD